MRHGTLKAVTVRAMQCSSFIAAGFLCALLAVSPARANFYSPKDGYGPGGSYQVNVEVTPYVWLPATDTKYSLGPTGGVSGSISTGVPTAAELKNSLHGAFMGYTLVRYGPWSAELDFDWIDASGGSSTVTPAGQTVHLSISTSVFRIAPGFGYQVFNGSVGSVPVTVDARAGLAVLIWNASFSSEQNLLGSAGNGRTFVQPWLGTRIDIYPAPRWRLDLAGAVQGFGVDGGSWGWGALASVGYGVTDWLTITGGFRALKSSRSEEVTGTDLSATRSIDTIAYGPVLGIGFRF